MRADKDYIASLVKKGGPSVDDYSNLQAWFRGMANRIRHANIHLDQIQEVKLAFGDAFSLQTMQGFSQLQPHGYAGDFEIIDRIHTTWISPQTHLQKWDYFFHAQPASCAVRNRKLYFQNAIIDNLSKTEKPITVLNIGSGPGRDMFEFFEANPETPVCIDCVDMDAKAIAFSTQLNQNFLHKLTFHHKNILRFKSERKYDLIWSAGLFDYLNDRTFSFLLNRLMHMRSTSGQVIIGNFALGNPSRDYMEFGGWNLIHRNPSQLRQLATKCIPAENQITIKMEPERVNLFMHIAPLPQLPIN